QPTLGINLLHLIKAEIKQPLDLRSEILHLRQQAQQLTPAGKIQDIIELIDNAILCKFPQLTQEELRAMFDLAEIKQTRVYQDAKQEGRLEGKLEGKLEGRLEGKLEAVPLLFQAGLSPEIIAQKLNLDLGLIEKVISPH
ncbi:Rpn family recombination-promoting nuclease/putative transposase, partial [Synechocystis salina LEGE 06155]|nr:Rpn family recombination-promoting nuclease/putative transposase [Synechocystis salina LEGE 06155]